MRSSIWFRGFRIASLLTFLVVLPILFVQQNYNLQVYSNFTNFSQLFTYATAQRCKYPRLNPFDPSILSFVDHPMPLLCDQFDYHPIFIRNATVFVNSSVELDDLQIYYRFVERANGSDHAFNQLDWTQFDQPVPLHSDHYSYVEFTLAEDISTISYDFKRGKVAFWAIYAMWPEIIETVRDSEKLNVIVFGIDSLSRSNVIRNLPQTYSFLQTQLATTILEGYVKVADNTFPNILATLTGRKPFSNELKGHYQKDFVDRWPFVWKNFSANGYKTVLAEEQPGVFTYKAKGFRDVPTDVYLRPVGMGLVNVTGKLRQSKYCVGDKPEISHILDNLQLILKDYHQRRIPFFSFSFLWKISHDKVNEVEIADLIVLRFLQNLHRSGVLNNAVLIVMSDHGNRFDHIRQTLVGRIEERMPFYSFAFPDWYRRQHPTSMRNLQLNSVRLASNYDIYETLLDILGLQSGSPRAISLFSEIPLNRTCDDAEIPQNFCVCQEESNLDVADPLVLKAAEFVVDYINVKLLSNVTDLCESLQLNRVLNAQLLQSNSDVVGNRKWRYGQYVTDGTATSLISYLRVTLIVAPGQGVFETSVQHDRGHSDGFQISTGDISRINAYGSAGNCVSLIDRRLEKFCLCRKT